MKVLVIGGTGKVGGALLLNLLAAGVDLCVLCRSVERIALLPAGAKGVAADITRDVAAAAPVFDGVDTVFMLNRPTLEEMPEGLLAVALARAAGVQRFVFQSVHAAEKMDYIPHVASKLAIERAVRASGMQWTILRPNYFFQNDLTARPGLDAGFYTAPVGNVGVASVDTGDIAAAAAICLLEQGHDGQSYNLVGPEVMTGTRCAAIWSEVLRCEIAYTGDVDRWRAMTRAFIPAWFNFDLAMMYCHLGTLGMPPDPGDVDRITALLKRPPRAYRDYVIEQAREWGMTCQ